MQREPGWPIQLLIQKNVKMTAINNLDKSMRSLWYSILNYPNKFINLINKTIVNIEEWPRQKEICKKEFNHPFSLEEGFATFFLNITNVSGMDLSQYLGHILVETVKPFFLLLILQIPVGLDSESSYGFDFGYKILQCS